MAQISVDDRLHVGVEGGNDRSFVFTECGVNLAGDGNLQLGKFGGHDFAGAGFMGRVEERKKKTDGNGINALVNQFPDSDADGVFIK